MPVLSFLFYFVKKSISSDGMEKIPCFLPIQKPPNSNKLEGHLKQIRKGIY